MQEKQKKLQEESRAEQEYIKKWQVFFFTIFFSGETAWAGGKREWGEREGVVCVWGGVHDIILDYGV